MKNKKWMICFFTLLLVPAALYAESSEEHLNKAVGYLEQGEYGKAAEVLDLLTTLDPKYAPGFLHRGMLYSREGNYTAALTDFEKAIALDSKMSEAYVGKSLVLFSQGDLEGTIKQLNKAIELNPGLGTAFYNRGMAYYYKGDFKRSLSDFEMARSLGEEVEPEIYEEVSMFRDLDASIARFSESITASPDDPLNYYNRGILYYHAQDFSKSLQDLQKAASLGMDLEEDLLEEIRLRASGKPLPQTSADQTIFDEAPQNS